MIPLMGACAGDVELSVSLQSDLVPGVEFSSVQLVLDDVTAQEIPITLKSSFASADRLADFPKLAPKNDRRIRLELVDIRGEVIAKTAALVDNRSSRAVILTIARSCVGVDCPGDGDPAALACLGGRCVDPRCTTGTEESCPTPQCTSTNDCDAASQPCLDVACIKTQCVYLQSNLCSDSQYCSPVTGCEPLPSDCPDGCADGNSCTQDLCEDGVCTYPVAGAGTLCENGVCDRGECISSQETCDDGVLNQDETGVDCGGVCNACSSEESCSDGVMNQDETGVDCGGAMCPACATCSDGVMNQDETGVDCGGAMCPACATCSDGVMNQGETEVDCGGPNCVACGSCGDGILNQDEVRIDCGGSICSPCYDCSAVTSIPESECNALLAFYYETGGPSTWVRTDGWVNNPNPCIWLGVGCSGGNVTSFNSENQNHTGTLPSQIEDLTELTTLYLDNNNYSGGIPASLANLTKLHTIHIQNSGLTGTIPTELGTMTQLTQLFLTGNELVGPIPTSFGNLVNMEWLRLRQNRLAGEVPPSFRMVGVNTAFVNVELRDQMGCLTCSDPMTVSFLDSKDGMWANGCP